MSDLQNHVNHIADQLENPDENHCRNCECEMDADEHGDCVDCGETLGPISGFDYLNDALDIEYTIGSDGSYRGARVLVTFGGPNIWVDTLHNRVEGHWWSESASVGFVDNIGLDDALRELWGCR